MFERDFTIEKYKQMCKSALESDLKNIRVKDYFLNDINKFFIMRHDVDRKSKSALKMASIEEDMGIVSTYYFRYKKDVFDPYIIKKIEDMGHEIGYHYEVLDKTKGAIEKAGEVFRKELAEFRRHVNVSTISVHGNPLSSNDPIEFLNQLDFKDLKIVGDASFSINFNDEGISYFADVGRTWDGRFSVKDKLSKNSTCSSTNDLTKILKDNKSKKFCIVTHPNRWADNNLDWIGEFVIQGIKNRFKVLLNN